MAEVRLPFKNPHKTVKRNKTLKQILVLERERADRLARERRDRIEREAFHAANELAAGRQPPPAQDVPEELCTCTFPESGAGMLTLDDRCVRASAAVPPPAEEVLRRDWPRSELSPSFVSMLSRQAPYVDPKSTLRFHNAEIYELIKTFSPGVIQSYLAIRGDEAILT